MNFRALGSSLILAMTAFAAQGNAAIVQVEAEEGTLGSRWETQANAGALGGHVIRGNADDGGSAPTVADQLATYTVNFPEAGTYDLYLRLALAAEDIADAIFIAEELGTPALDDGDIWANQNSLAVGKSKLADMPTADGPLASAFTADDLIWINASAVFSDPTIAGVQTSSDDAVPTFTVAAPGPLSFQLANRQGSTTVGLQIDAIAFALTSEAARARVGIGGSLLLVPEPSTVVLGCLLLGSSLVTGTDRRRRYRSSGKL